MFYYICDIPYIGLNWVYRLFKPVPSNRLSWNFTHIFGAGDNRIKYTQLCIYFLYNLPLILTILHFAPSAYAAFSTEEEYPTDAE